MRLNATSILDQYREVHSAVAMVNQFLHDEQGPFASEMNKVQGFMCSQNRDTDGKVSGGELFHILMNETHDVNVNLKKKYWLFCREEYAEAKTPWTIEINNIYTTSRSVAEIVGYLLHACVHLVNHQDKLSFGHTGSCVEKMESAPYSTGIIAQNTAKEIFKLREEDEIRNLFLSPEFKVAMAAFIAGSRAEDVFKEDMFKQHLPYLDDNEHKYPSDFNCIIL